ncbi:HNH endonuclease signature motif containing protein [Amycolatopsis rubida]|uniref:HNH endonuclease n=1 Tax=Amycolatopsis rubida TaxID=112413 RepID=A0A1I5IJL9_9PSEU|nr:HNH endonuclease signature motif containing protein [Amycolatopsis rubida]SFO60614.1 HNH endonuclease [Amycolatopsis rubida]
MLRRTPLRRRGFLARGAGLKRTAPLKARRRSKADARAEWSEDDGKKALEARSECCERCGNGGRLDWHHRKNRSQGGGWNPANGLRLCRPCHRFVTVNPDAGRVGGWCVKPHEDSAEVPFEHWQWGPVRITDDTTTYHIVQEGQAS